MLTLLELLAYATLERQLEISSSGISLWAIACFADRVEAEQT